MVCMSLVSWLFGSEDDELQAVKDEIREVKQSIESLEERIDSHNEHIQAHDSDITELTHRVHELEPVAADLTDREREVLEVLVDRNGFVEVEDVRQELDTTYQNAGTLLRNIRDKIDLDVRTGDKNKKTYKLTESVESDLFGQR